MKLKFVTWNLWNSFKSVKSPIEIAFLEPLPRIRQRHAQQNRILDNSQIDAFFLQEVNPLRLRLKDWKIIFKNINYQVDQGGLKLFGRGLPMNFENALVIASKHRLKVVKTLKLSPSIGFNNRMASFQWLELRYAIFSELNLDGKRVLLVNTHLHHGVEWTKNFKQEVETAYSNKEITQQDYDSLLLSISQSTHRKQQELIKLSNEIRAQAKHYHHIVVAGDFNMSDESPYFDHLEGIGLEHIKFEQGHTWNGLENDANIVYSNQLEPPVKDLQTTKALDLLKENNKLPRNIDHFFVSKSVKVNGLDFFAKEKNDRGFYPSDHFGLQMEVEID